MAVPELSMILPAQIISNIEPLTHTLNAMFDIFLREISFTRIVQVCLFLLIYPFVIGFLIRKRLVKRLETKEGLSNGYLFCNLRKVLLGMLENRCGCYYWFLYAL